MEAAHLSPLIPFERNEYDYGRGRYHAARS